MLSTSLALVPEHCTCGNATAHLKGECACCAERNRLSAAHCADCDALLEKIETQIHALVLDILRFLPPVSPGALTADEGARRISADRLKRSRQSSNVCEAPRQGTERRVIQRASTR